MAYVIKIRNNERYQHYSKRNPPWVKLYQSVLEDYQVLALTDAERYHFLVLILLAAKTNNSIPMDPYYIQSTGKTQTPVLLTKLARLQFIEIHPEITWDELQAWDEETKKVFGQNIRLVAMADAEVKYASNTPEPEPGEEPGEAPAPKLNGTVTPAAKPDPLEEYMTLATYYDEIVSDLREAHPDVRIPEAGSASWYSWRNELARIARVDNYAEDEIVTVLKWMYTEEDRTGRFSWCDVTMSLASLRRKQKGDTVTKFDKIFNAYTKNNRRNQGTYVGQTDLGF